MQGEKYRVLNRYLSGYLTLTVQVEFVGKNANALQKEILQRIGALVRRWKRWVLSVLIGAVYHRSNGLWNYSLSRHQP
jgi:hypothetical protein